MATSKTASGGATVGGGVSSKTTSTSSSSTQRDTHQASWNARKAASTAKTTTAKTGTLGVSKVGTYTSGSDTSSSNKSNIWSKLFKTDTSTATAPSKLSNVISGSLTTTSSTTKAPMAVTSGTTSNNILKQSSHTTNSTTTGKETASEGLWNPSKTTSSINLGESTNGKETKEERLVVPEKTFKEPELSTEKDEKLTITAKEDTDKLSPLNNGGAKGTLDASEEVKSGATKVPTISYKDEKTGTYFVIPTTYTDINGEHELTKDEAIDRYKSTGDSYGSFKTEDEANKYATKITAEAKKNETTNVEPVETKSEEELQAEYMAEVEASLAQDKTVEKYIDIDGMTAEERKTKQWGSVDDLLDDSITRLNEDSALTVEYGWMDAEQRRLYMQDVASVIDDLESIYTKHPDAFTEEQVEQLNSIYGDAYSIYYNLYNLNEYYSQYDDVSASVDYVTDINPNGYTTNYLEREIARANNEMEALSKSNPHYNYASNIAKVDDIEARLEELNVMLLDAQAQEKAAKETEAVNIGLRNMEFAGALINSPEGETEEERTDREKKVWTDYYNGLTAYTNGNVPEYLKGYDAETQQAALQDLINYSAKMAGIETDYTQAYNSHENDTDEQLSARLTELTYKGTDGSDDFDAEKLTVEEQAERQAILALQQNREAERTREFITAAWDTAKTKYASGQVGKGVVQDAKAKVDDAQEKLDAFYAAQEEVKSKYGGYADNELGQENLAKEMANVEKQFGTEEELKANLATAEEEYSTLSSLRTYDIDQDINYTDKIAQGSEAYNKFFSNQANLDQLAQLAGQTTEDGNSALGEYLFTNGLVKSVADGNRVAQLVDGAGWEAILPSEAVQSDERINNFLYLLAEDGAQAAFEYSLNINNATNREYLNLASEYGLEKWRDKLGGDKLKTIGYALVSDVENMSSVVTWVPSLVDDLKMAKNNVTYVSRDKNFAEKLSDDMQYINQMLDENFGTIPETTIINGKEVELPLIGGKGLSFVNSVVASSLQSEAGMMLGAAAAGGVLALASCVPGFAAAAGAFATTEILAGTPFAQTGLGLLTKAFTDVAFGGNAMTQTIAEQLANGADINSATQYGALTGFNEMLFETVSIELLYKAKTDALPNGWKDFIGRVAIGGDFEGSEEIFTDAANLVADYLVNGDKNELQQTIDSYMAMGYTEEDATRRAYKSKVGEMIDSFVAGKMSGGMSQAVNLGSRVIDAKVIGHSMNNDYPSLAVDMANNVDTMDFTGMDEEAVGVLKDIATSIKEKGSASDVQAGDLLRAYQNLTGSNKAIQDFVYENPQYTAVFTADMINAVQSHYEKLLGEDESAKLFDAMAGTDGTVLTDLGKSLVDAGLTSEEAIDVQGKLAAIVDGSTSYSVSKISEFVRSGVMANEKVQQAVTSFIGNQVLNNADSYLAQVVTNIPTSVDSGTALVNVLSQAWEATRGDIQGQRVRAQYRKDVQDASKLQQKLNTSAKSRAQARKEARAAKKAAKQAQKNGTNSTEQTVENAEAPAEPTASTVNNQQTQSASSTPSFANGQRIESPNDTIYWMNQKISRADFIAQGYGTNETFNRVADQPAFGEQAPTFAGGLRSSASSDTINSNGGNTNDRTRENGQNTENDRGVSSDEGMGRGSSERGGQSGQDTVLTWLTKRAKTITGSLRQSLEGKAPNTKLHALAQKNFQKYQDAITEARDSNPYGAAVDIQTVESLKESNARAFLAQNGMSGVAVTADGDIVGLFSHEANPINHTVSDSLCTAILNGGRKLDCFMVDGGSRNLVSMYASWGFVPVAWTQFDLSIWEEGHPGEAWPSMMGEPKVVFMVYNGKSLEENIAANTTEGTKWNWANLEEALGPAVDYDTGYEIHNRLAERVAGENTAGNVITVEDAVAMRKEIEAEQKQEATAEAQETEQRAKAEPTSFADMTPAQLREEIAKAEVELTNAKNKAAEAGNQLRELRKNGGTERDIFTCREAIRANEFKAAAYQTAIEKLNELLEGKTNERNSSDGVRQANVDNSGNAGRTSTRSTDTSAERTEELKSLLAENEALGEGAFVLSDEAIESNAEIKAAVELAKSVGIEKVFIVNGAIEVSSPKGVKSTCGGYYESGKNFLVLATVADYGLTENGRHEVMHRILSTRFSNLESEHTFLYESLLQIFNSDAILAEVFNEYENSGYGDMANGALAVISRRNPSKYGLEGYRTTEQQEACDAFKRAYIEEEILCDIYGGLARFGMNGQINYTNVLTYRESLRGLLESGFTADGRAYDSMDDFAENMREATEAQESTDLNVENEQESATESQETTEDTVENEQETGEESQETTEQPVENTQENTQESTEETVEIQDPTKANTNEKNLFKRLFSGVKLFGKKYSNDETSDFYEEFSLNNAGYRTWGYNPIKTYNEYTDANVVGVYSDNLKSVIYNLMGELRDNYEELTKGKNKAETIEQKNAMRFVSTALKPLMDNYDAVMDNLTEQGLELIAEDCDTILEAYDSGKIELDEGFASSLKNLVTLLSTGINYDYAYSRTENRLISKREMMEAINEYDEAAEVQKQAEHYQNTWYTVESTIGYANAPRYSINSNINAVMADNDQQAKAWGANTHLNSVGESEVTKYYAIGTTSQGAVITTTDVTKALDPSNVFYGKSYNTKMVLNNISKEAIELTVNDAFEDGYDTIAINPNSADAKTVFVLPVDQLKSARPYVFDGAGGLIHNRFEAGSQRVTELTSEMESKLQEDFDALVKQIAEDETGIEKLEALAENYAAVKGFTERVVENVDPTTGLVTYTHTNENTGIVLNPGASVSATNIFESPTALRDFISNSKSDALPKNANYKDYISACNDYEDSGLMTDGAYATLLARNYVRRLGYSTINYEANGGTSYLVLNDSARANTDAKSLMSDSSELEVRYSLNENKQPFILNDTAINELTNDMNAYIKALQRVDASPNDKQAKDALDNLGNRIRNKFYVIGQTGGAITQIGIPSREFVISGSIVLNHIVPSKRRGSNNLVHEQINPATFVNHLVNVLSRPTAIAYYAERNYDNHRVTQTEIDNLQNDYNALKPIVENLWKQVEPIENKKGRTKQEEALYQEYRARNKELNALYHSIDGAKRTLDLIQLGSKHPNYSYGLKIMSREKDVDGNPITVVLRSAPQFNYENRLYGKREKNPYMLDFTYDTLVSMYGALHQPYGTWSENLAFIDEESIIPLVEADIKVEDPTLQDYMRAPILKTLDFIFAELSPEAWHKDGADVEKSSLWFANKSGENVDLHEVLDYRSNIALLLPQDEANVILNRSKVDAIAQLPIHETGTDKLFERKKNALTTKYKTPTAKQVLERIYNSYDGAFGKVTGARVALMSEIGGVKKILGFVNISRRVDQESQQMMVDFTDPEKLDDPFVVSDAPLITGKYIYNVTNAVAAIRKSDMEKFAGDIAQQIRDSYGSEEDLGLIKALTARLKLFNNKELDTILKAVEDTLGGLEQDNTDEEYYKALEAAQNAIYEFADDARAPVYSLNSNLKDYVPYTESKTSKYVQQNFSKSVDTYEVMSRLSSDSAKQHGVSQAEITFSGVETWLSEQRARGNNEVSRRALSEFLDNKNSKVEVTYPRKESTEKGYLPNTYSTTTIRNADGNVTAKVSTANYVDALGGKEVLHIDRIVSGDGNSSRILGVKSAIAQALYTNKTRITWDNDSQVSEYLRKVAGQYGANIGRTLLANNNFANDTADIIKNARASGMTDSQIIDRKSDKFYPVSYFDINASLANDLYDGGLPRYSLNPDLFPETTSIAGKYVQESFGKTKKIDDVIPFLTSDTARKKGVRQDEITYSGVETWLEELKSTGADVITRQQLADFFNNTGLNISVKELSENAYDRENKALAERENRTDQLADELIAAARALDPSTQDLFIRTNLDTASRFGIKFLADVILDKQVQKIAEPLTKGYEGNPDDSKVGWVLDTYDIVQEQFKNNPRDENDINFELNVIKDGGEKIANDIYKARKQEFDALAKEGNSNDIIPIIKASVYYGMRFRNTTKRANVLLNFTEDATERKFLEAYLNYSSYVKEREATISSIDNLRPKWGQYAMEAADPGTYMNILISQPGATYTTKMMGMHWGKENSGVLVHLRADEIQDALTGETAFNIEEIQSDWQNAKTEPTSKVNKTIKDAEENGYPYTEEEIAEKRAQAKSEADLVPEMPFAKTYVELALKSALKHAVDSGIGRLTWAPATLQANRWSWDFIKGYENEYGKRGQELTKGDIPTYLQKLVKQYDGTIGWTVVGVAPKKGLTNAKVQKLIADAQVGKGNTDASQYQAVPYLDIGPKLAEAVRSGSLPRYSLNSEYFPETTSAAGKYVQESFGKTKKIDDVIPFLTSDTARKKGVRQDEITLSGVETWLQDLKSTGVDVVSRQQLKDFFDNKDLDIEVKSLRNEEYTRAEELLNGNYYTRQSRALDEAIDGTLEKAFPGKKREDFIRGGYGSPLSYDPSYAGKQLLSDKYMPSFDDTRGAKSLGRDLSYAISVAITDRFTTSRISAENDPNVTYELVKTALKNGIDSTVEDVAKEFFGDNPTPGELKAVRLELTIVIRNYLDYDEDRLIEEFANEDEKAFLQAVRAKQDLDKAYSSAYRMAQNRQGPRWKDFALDAANRNTYNEILISSPTSDYSVPMMETHWGEENTGVLVHLREDEVPDILTGGTDFNIEEVQSDWMNAKRKPITEANKRIKDAEDEGRPFTALEIAEIKHDAKLESDEIPDMPFAKTHTELALKSALAQAVNKGLNRITWTPATLQANRWDWDFIQGYEAEYGQRGKELSKGNIPEYFKKLSKEFGGDMGWTVIGTSGTQPLTEDAVNMLVDGAKDGSLNSDVMRQLAMPYFDISDKLADAVRNGALARYSLNSEYFPETTSMAGKYVQESFGKSKNIEDVIPFLTSDTARKKGVRQDEITFSGVKEWLFDLGNHGVETVTRQQLKDFFDNSQLNMETVIKDEAEYQAALDKLNYNQRLFDAEERVFNTGSSLFADRAIYPRPIEGARDYVSHAIDILSKGYMQNLANTADDIRLSDEGEAYMKEYSDVLATIDRLIVNTFWSPAAKLQHENVARKLFFHTEDLVSEIREPIKAVFKNESGSKYKPNLTDDIIDNLIKYSLYNAYAYSKQHAYLSNFSNLDALKAIALEEEDPRFQDFYEAVAAYESEEAELNAQKTDIHAHVGTNFGNYANTYRTTNSYRETLLRQPDLGYANRYMEIHWGDIDGILTHLRTDTMTDLLADKEVFNIEEIQSDLNNERRGYISRANKYIKQEEDAGRPLSEEEIQKIKDDAKAKAEKVPATPFSKTETELGLKSALAQAVAGGYDRIVWTPAIVQANRWSPEFMRGYETEYGRRDKPLDKGEIPEYFKSLIKQYGGKMGETLVGSKSYLDYYTESDIPAIKEEMNKQVGDTKTGEFDKGVIPAIVVPYFDISDKLADAVKGGALARYSLNSEYFPETTSQAGRYVQESFGKTKKIEDVMPFLTSDTAKKKGVRQDEITFSGVENWLNDQKSTGVDVITRQQLKDFFDGKDLKLALKQRSEEEYQNAYSDYLNSANFANPYELRQQIMQKSEEAEALFSAIRDLPTAYKNSISASSLGEENLLFMTNDAAKAIVRDILDKQTGAPQERNTKIIDEASQYLDYLLKNEANRRGGDGKTSSPYLPLIANEEIREQAIDSIMNKIATVPDILDVFLAGASTQDIRGELYYLLGESVSILGFNDLLSVLNNSEYAEMANAARNYSALIAEELPKVDVIENEQREQEKDLEHQFSPRWKQYAAKTQLKDSYKETILTQPGLGYTNHAMGVHWGSDTPGVLVHLRTDEAVDAFTGEVVFNIEEIQSDLSNERVAIPAKTNKFINDNFDILSAEDIEDLKAKDAEELAKIPSTPFSKTYTELALKSAIYQAVTNGMGRITWATAIQQADRWHLDSLQGYEHEYGKIGKELTKGDIPEYLQKLVKQFGGEIGWTRIGEQSDEAIEDTYEAYYNTVTSGVKYHIDYQHSVVCPYFDISDKLANAILNGELPRYSMNSNTATVDNTDATLTSEQIDFFSKSLARDKQDRLVKFYESNSIDGWFTNNADDAKPIKESKLFSDLRANEPTEFYTDIRNPIFLISDDPQSDNFTDVMPRDFDGDGSLESVAEYAQAHDRDGVIVKGNNGADIMARAFNREQYHAVENVKPATNVVYSLNSSIMTYNSDGDRVSVGEIIGHEDEPFVDLNDERFKNFFLSAGPSIADDPKFQLTESDNEELFQIALDFDKGIAPSDAKGIGEYLRGFGVIQRAEEILSTIPHTLEEVSLEEYNNSMRDNGYYLIKQTKGDNVIVSSMPASEIERRRENAIAEIESYGYTVPNEDNPNKYHYKKNGGAPIRQERIAHIVTGLPAAGKSSVFVDRLSNEYHARIIDSDDIKTTVALRDQFRNGWGAGAVHLESKDISSDVITRAVFRGDNIIIPIIGDDLGAIIKRVNVLNGLAQETGDDSFAYRVFVHFNDVPSNKAMSRAFNRFRTTGRYIPYDILAGYEDKPTQAYFDMVEAIENRKVVSIDGYTWASNNVAPGQQPIIRVQSPSFLRFDRGYKLREDLRELPSDGRPNQENGEEVSEGHKFSLNSILEEDKYADAQGNTAIYRGKPMYFGLFDARSGAVKEVVDRAHYKEGENPFSEEGFKNWASGRYMDFWVHNGKLFIDDGRYLDREELQDLKEIPFNLASNLDLPNGEQAIWTNNEYHMYSLNQSDIDAMGEDTLDRAIYDFITTTPVDNMEAGVEALEQWINQRYESLTTPNAVINQQNAIQNGPMGNAERQALYAENERQGRAHGFKRPGVDKKDNRVIIPNKNDERRNYRQYEQTVIGAETIPDNVADEFLRQTLDIENDMMTYMRSTDSAAMQSADTIYNDYMRRYGEAGFDRIIKERWKPLIQAEAKVSKRDIALGEKILMEAAHNNRVDIAMEIGADLCVLGTELGQAVQALSLLKKMTPSGQLYYMTNVVNRLNKKYEKQIAKGKAQTIVIDNDLAAAVYNAETMDEVNTAMENLKQDIANQLPVTWADRWNAWRYFSMLGNPRTHIRNVLGNAVFKPAVFLKNVMGTLTEKAIDPSLRTKAIFIKPQYKEFALGQFESDADIVSGNGKYNTANELMSLRHLWGQSKLGMTMEKIMKINSEGFSKDSKLGQSKLTSWIGLENEDMLFLKNYYVNALAGFLQARGADVNTLRNARGGKQLLNEARSYAIREAQKATYRDFNAAAAALNNVKRTPGIGMFIEGLVPFTKTPANILSRGIEYSPLGLFTGIKNMVSSVQAFKNENSEITRQGVTEALDTLCAKMSGTSICIMGALLAGLGILRGAGAEDDDENEFDKLQGHQSFALEIGNVSYTIDWMAPVALPLFVGAQAYETLSDGFDINPWELVDVFLNILNPMSSLSLLDGINNTISSVAYAREEEIPFLLAGSMFESYISQGLPTLGGQLARTLDADRRTTYIDKNSDLPDSMQSFIQSDVMAKIPGLSSMRSKYVNNWGEYDTNDNVLLRIFENFLSPGYINVINSTPADVEIQRLFDATGNTSVLPPYTQKYYNDDGIRVNLTAEEYEQYSTTRGQNAKALITNIISNPLYQGLSSDADKIAIIEEAYDYANQVAKMTVFGWDEEEDWINLADKFGADDYVILKSDIADADTIKATYELALTTPYLSDTQRAQLIARKYSKPDSITDPDDNAWSYELTAEAKDRAEEIYAQKFTENYVKIIGTDVWENASTMDEKIEVLDDVKTVSSEETVAQLTTEIENGKFNITPDLRSATAVKQKGGYDRLYEVTITESNLSPEKQAKYIASVFAGSKSYKSVDFTSDMKVYQKAMYTEVFTPDYVELVSSDKFANMTLEQQKTAISKIHKNALSKSKDLTYTAYKNNEIPKATASEIRDILANQYVEE